MNKKPSRVIKFSGNFFEGIAQRAKLIVRLMIDRRVSPWLKLLPIGSLIYLVNPFDIPGPFDDIAVVSLGLYLFVELCPPAVVQEHMSNLRSVVDAEVFKPAAHDEVVDAEFREASQEGADAQR